MEQNFSWGARLDFWTGAGCRHLSWGQQFAMGCDEVVWKWKVDENCGFSNVTCQKQPWDGDPFQK